MAQLTSKVFQLIQGGYRESLDLFVAAGQTAVEPGILIKYTSGSTIGLADQSVVHGIAFGTRAMTYAPTTQVFTAGEPIVRVYGRGEALVSGDFFTSGTLPTAGSNIYAGTNGLWDATASSGVKVGRCIKQETVKQPVGASGTAVTVARVQFEFAA